MADPILTPTGDPANNVPTVPETPPTTPETPEETPTTPETPEPTKVFKVDKEETPKPPSTPKTPKNDPIDSDDAKIIDDRLNAQVDPVKAELAVQSVKLEVSDYLNNPDNKKFRQYRDQIMKVAVAPEFANVTTEAIAYMVAGKDIAFNAVKQSKETDAKAKKNQIGKGNTVPLGKTDYTTMNSADFAKAKQQLHASHQKAAKNR